MRNCKRLLILAPFLAIHTAQAMHKESVMLTGPNQGLDRSALIVHRLLNSSLLASEDPKEDARWRRMLKLHAILASYNKKETTEVEKNLEQLIQDENLRPMLIEEAKWPPRD